MKITELQAYKRLKEMFEQKGYSLGIKDDMPIYCWDNVHCIPENLTPGHYVGAIRYSKIKKGEIVMEKLNSEIFLRNIVRGNFSYMHYQVHTRISLNMSKHIPKSLTSNSLKTILKQNIMD